MNQHQRSAAAPDDEIYWDALAERVARQALSSGPQASLAAFTGSTAGWIAALVVISGATGLVLIEGHDGAATVGADAVRPRDRVGQLIAGADRPPSIGVLLLTPDAEVFR